MTSTTANPDPTRVHDPSRGWGIVSTVVWNLMHLLYEDPKDPTHFAFVRWDSGGGGWIDPARIDLMWVNFNALELPR